VRLLSSAKTEQKTKQKRRPKAAGPRFTLEVAPVPGITPEDARRLTVRGVCAALAEVTRS